MAEPLLRAIIGLGNPGSEYDETRHNAGFWFVEALARQAGARFRIEPKFQGEVCKAQVAGVELLLMKPTTFMNRSGQAVQPLAAFYKIAPEQILIAHDELDLPAGAVRLKRGGGHGGHNGLRDLHAQLGEAYARLRVGIGHPGHKDRVLGYVLGRPPLAERRLIDAALLRAEAILPSLFSAGWERAMTQLHSDPDNTP